MSSAQFVIELLKIMVSAPVATVAILLPFMVLYRRELKALIGRIISVKFPGGELTASQAERELALAKTDWSAGCTDSSVQGGLLQETELSSGEQSQTRDLLDAEKALSQFWEYQFLNRFLVPNSQRVLDWIASLRQRATFELYDALCSPTIQDPIERRAIIIALHNHHLISVADSLIEITPKGLDYIQWRGPLPQLFPLGIKSTND